MEKKPYKKNKVVKTKSNDQKKVIKKKNPNKPKYKWTADQKLSITKFVHDTQNLVKLQDWKIKVVWDSFCDEFDDAYATNTPIGDSRHCEIRFSRRFLELDNYEMTQAVVHELMHCYLFAVEDYTEDMFEKATDKKTYELFNIGHSKLIETAIDGIADGIAKNIPGYTLPNRAKLLK